MYLVNEKDMSGEDMIVSKHSLTTRMSASEATIILMHSEDMSGQVLLICECLLTTFNRACEHRRHFPLLHSEAGAGGGMMASHVIVSVILSLEYLWTCPFLTLIFHHYISEYDYSPGLRKYSSYGESFHVS